MLRLNSSLFLQYFVTSDMTEAPQQPTIQMMSTSETAPGPTIVDAQSLHGGKFRIVNNEDVAAALQPTRKIITINQQQYVVSQGDITHNSYLKIPYLFREKKFMF